MTQPRADWPTRLVPVIAGEVRRHRQRRGFSAQQLADATEDLGMPVPRSVLANLENGRRESVSVAELYVLAEALQVPPLLLLLPLGHEQTVEALPGVEVTTTEALSWLRGERPLRGGVWEGREDAESPTVYFFVMHRDLLERWRRHRLFADKVRDLPDGGENAAQEDERQATKAAEELLTVRRLMRRQDLTPPPLPPELAVREEALA